MPGVDYPWGVTSVNTHDRAEAQTALAEAMTSADSERIARVASAYAWTLVSMDYEELVAALAALPDSSLQEHLVLRVVHPMAIVMSGAPPHPIVPPLEAELRALDERRLADVLHTHLVAYRLNGDIDGSMLYAERLDRLLQQPRIPTVGDPSGPLPLFHYQLGVTFLLAGHTLRALSALSAAQQLAALDPENDVQRAASARMAVAHAMRGSVFDAETSLSAAAALAVPSRFFQICTPGSERIARALIALERMDENLGELMDALGSLDAPDELWPCIMHARALYALALSLPASALEAVRLAQHSRVIQRGTLADDVGSSAMIDAYHALDEHGAAERVLAETYPKGTNAHLPFTTISWVRHLLHRGDAAAAASECRALSGMDELPLASRSEILLVLLWSLQRLEQPISKVQAGAAAQLVIGGKRRRLFTTVPREVIEAIADELDDEAAEFRRQLQGLTFAQPLPTRPALTPGESKVLAALLTNATTAEIARALFVSPNTVKTQLASIYRKLGVSGRKDAMAVAEKLHLVSAEDAPTDPGHRPGHLRRGA